MTAAHHNFASADFDRRLGTPQSWMPLGDLMRALATIEQRYGKQHWRYSRKLGEYNRARNFDAKVKAMAKIEGMTLEEARELAVAAEVRKAVKLAVAS